MPGICVQPKCISLISTEKTCLKCKMYYHSEKDILLVGGLKLMLGTVYGKPLYADGNTADSINTCSLKSCIGTQMIMQWRKTIIQFIQLEASVHLIVPPLSQ